MDTRQLRVLIVDDEQSVRRNIEKTLSNAGYVVRTANNGEQALREVENLNYDLIVLDIIMPDWTGKLSNRAGVDVLKELRTKGILTPVIMLSANKSIELVSESIDYAPMKYLVKGNVSNQEFLRTVNDAIKMEKQITDDPYRGNQHKPQKEKLRKWLIDRTSGVLDEILAGLVIAGMMYAFGIISGELRGKPLDWLKDDINYLVSSGIVIFGVLAIYVIIQRKSK